MDYIELCQVIDKRNILCDKRHTKSDTTDFKFTKYIQETVDMAKSINYIDGIFAAKIVLIQREIAFGRTENIHNKFETLLNTYNLATVSTRNKMKYYGVLSLYYSEFKADFAQAVNYSKKEMELAEQLDDIQEIMRIKMNIGALSISLKYYVTATEFLNEAKVYYESINDYVLLCYCYLNLSDVYKQCDRNAEAKEYLLHTIKLATQENELGLKYFATHEMGLITSKEKNYDQALNYLKEAIQLSEEAQSNNGIIQVYLDLIHVYIMIENYNQALIELTRIEEIIQQTEKKELIKTFYKNKSMICKALGEVDEAYEALLNYCSCIEEEDSDKEKCHQTMNNVIQEEYSKNTKRLKTIARVGRELTMLSDIDEVLLRVRIELMKVISFEVIGIGIVDEDSLCFNHYFANNKKVSPKNIPLSNKTSLATWCIDNDKDVIINDIENEYSEYISQVKRIRGSHYDGEDIVRSLMYAPLKVNDEIIGVFTIQSSLKDAYSSIEVDIFKIISDYVAITIKNVLQKTALENLSERDILTKMYNRRGFIDFYNQHMLTDSKTVSTIGIIMLDLDHFKVVNDTYGHLVGDEVLIIVGRYLMSKEALDIRSGRLGGEEFGLILLNKGKEFVENMAIEIKNDIEKLEIIVDNQTIKMTTSIGVSLSENAENSDYNQLYFEADNALYSAKNKGRNRVDWYRNF